MHNQILGQHRGVIRERNSNFVNGIIDCVTYEPDIAVENEIIDKNLVSFKNGVLNLKTGVFSNHSPLHKTLYAVMANYLGNTNNIYTPVFDSFLNSIIGEGDELISIRLLEIIGLCFTPDNSAKAIVVFRGVGDSGKSLLCNLIEKLLSNGAYSPIKADKLKGRFTLSSLQNRVVCAFNDMPNEALGNKETSTLKELSGNDTIWSDVKFGDAVAYKSYAKIILTTNHSIVTKTNDTAFFNRIVCVPFTRSIPKTEQDPRLPDKLFQEADGIVTKCIHAYYRLVKNQYQFTGSYEVNEVVDLNSNSETILQ